MVLVCCWCGVGVLLVCCWCGVGVVLVCCWCGVGVLLVWCWCGVGVCVGVPCHCMFCDAKDASLDAAGDAVLAGAGLEDKKAGERARGRV